MLVSQRHRLSVLHHHICGSTGGRSLTLAAGATSTSSSLLGPTQKQREELETIGYTIIDVGELCEPDMFARLKAAAKRVVEAARELPPTEANMCGAHVLRDRPGKDVWGIRGLFAPGLNEPVFAEYMASRPVLEYVRALMECSEDDLMLPDADSLIFCNPRGVDRAQAWHRDTRWWGLDTSAGRRDTGRTGGILVDEADFSLEAERARWEELQAGPDRVFAYGKPRLSGHNTYLANNGGAYFRWELALDEQTTGLEIVPGSHRRFRNDFERDCLLPRRARSELPTALVGASSRAMSDGQGGDSLMPDAIFVALKPGQAVIWNGDMLHRGRTVKDVERLTLSCSWSQWTGCKVPPPTIIDQTVEWKLKLDVRDALPAPWMRRSWDRWLLTQYSPEQIVSKYPGLLPVDCERSANADAFVSWANLRAWPCKPFEPA